MFNKHSQIWTVTIISINYVGYFRIDITQAVNISSDCQKFCKCLLLLISDLSYHVTYKLYVKYCNGFGFFFFFLRKNKKFKILVPSLQLGRRINRWVKHGNRFNCLAYETTCYIRRHILRLCSQMYFNVPWLYIEIMNVFYKL